MSRDRFRRIPMPPDAVGFSPGIQPELKQRKPEVLLGEPFQLFPNLRKRLPQYTSEFNLTDPKGVVVSINTYARPFTGGLKEPIITPFHPEIGYRFTSDDYDPDPKKFWNKYRHWLHTTDPAMHDPLHLLIQCEYPTLASRPAVLQLLLTANSLTYKAQEVKPPHPDEFNPLYRLAEFADFYPMKPLPHFGVEGFSVYVPNDIEALNSLSAKLIIPQQIDQIDRKLTGDELTTP